MFEKLKVVFNESPIRMLLIGALLVGGIFSPSEGSFLSIMFFQIVYSAPIFAGMFITYKLSK